MKDSSKDRSHPFSQKNGKCTPEPEEFVPISPMGTEGYIWTDEDFPPEDLDEEIVE
jgi:hypothetical protein